MSEDELKQVKQAQRVDTDRIFTLPNMLSFFRLGLIPLIIYFYESGHFLWAFALLFLSGVTDVVDGWIARTYHLVTDFGKAIDPIADKLTQIAVLLCLMDMKYWWVVGVMVFKEISIGILTLLALKRTHSIYSAGWYGKLCTVVIYLSMFTLLLWSKWGTPSDTFILIDCLLICATVLLAFAKYFVYFVKILRRARENTAQEEA